MSLRLVDIPQIANALKTASTKAISLLNDIIFDIPHDRTTRGKLREFTGFPTTFNVEDRKTKIKQKFTLTDFVQVSNILSLEITTDLDTLCNNIFDNLCNLTQLRQNILDDSNNSELEESSQPSTNIQQIPPPATLTLSENNFPYTPRSMPIGLSIKEIADEIKNFDGYSAYPITSFIDSISNISELYNLTDIQTLAVAKRCLTGTAKIFLNSLPTIQSWADFKTTFLEEFEEKYTSADIHKILSNRSKKRNETCTEYLINMRQIAQKAAIDEKSVCQYVIEGLPNSPNKLLLYGCNNYKELKSKLLIFEKLLYDNSLRHSAPQYNHHSQRNYSFPAKNSSASVLNSQSPVPPRHVNQTDENTRIKCFQCGDKNHMASECNIKELRCFYCKAPNHKISACPKKARQQSARALTSQSNSSVHQVATLATHPSSMTLTIYIKNICLPALVDTGSPYTLIRESVYRKLGSPVLHNTSLTLTGLGATVIHPIGFFHMPFKIQHSAFTSDFFVISDHLLSVDLILGQNVLQQGEFKLNKSGVELIESDITANNSTVHFCVPLTPHTIVTDAVLPYSNDSFAGVIESSSLPDLSHISDRTIRTELSQLITSYNPTKIKSPEVEMNIVLSDDRPVHHRPRRLPQSEQKIVDAQIQTWLNEGIIKPSCSDYSSPVVLCKKKDGSHRLCVDYRHLNKIIVRDRFPLPLIDDVVDRLENSAIFTKLDLKNGFFHVPINPSSTKFTSFVVPNGQYEFLYAPFGLCVSPNIFQRYIYAIFRPLMAQNIVVIYLDDFIIPAKNETEALQKLKTVLQVASEHGLELNFKKCSFLQKRIEFLGYVIQNGTIQPSPSKTAAVKNFPIPKDVKHLQSFLGLTGYFRKFIYKYSLIAKPLTDLLRGNVPFHFGESQMHAFNQLKDILSKSPVLHIFRQGSKLELHTDASSHGFGSVLLQQEDDNQFYPIHYMSRKTTPQQEKLSSYELEVLAIIESLKKFRTYLLGSKFTIVTDCQAFQKTIHKKDVTPKIARWSAILDEFEYKIVHRPGRLMPHVDALSRHAVCLVTDNSELTAKIASAQANDDQVRAIKNLCQSDSSSTFFVKNDVLYKYHNGLELLVVPYHMQTQIVRDAHLQGHFSVDKTENIVKQSFYIPNLRKCIETVIANCVECILVNKKRGKAEGFLHPIPKEDVPFCTFHLDFLGPLPSTNKQYNHIFAVVDAFTKFLWLFPVKSTSTKEALLKLSVIQTTFGNPSRIITDRGAAFTSNDFHDYCTDQQIELVHITTGIPRANGQIERMLQTVIPVLSKLSIDDPTKWFKHVESVQRTLNSTISSSTNRSPFELLVGVPMRHKQDSHILQLLQEEHVNSFIDQRNALRNIAKENILKLQQTNKRTFNKHRKKAHPYQLNDMVAIARTQFGSGLKLRPRFHGPYKITKVKPHDRYEVEKIGMHEGPNITSTSADHMKPWTSHQT